MRVLIADDDAGSTGVVTRALQRDGFEVIAAPDGLSAWERLTACAPPLAILDWTMPGLDGLELCRRIRATPAHAHMYVLLLTGRMDRGDIIAGLEAGADDYLTKPPDVHELRARVQVGVRVVQASAERERLLDSMSSILIQVDARGRVIRWNAAAQETFGIAAGAVIGSPLRDCGIAWTHPELVSRLMEGPVMPAHLEDVGFVDAAGSTRLVALAVTMLQRDDAAPAGADGFVLFGSEVTTRRALEQQLRQSQKLESVGQLAAGIAHEINTPMQYVGDNVRFLQDVHGSLGTLFDSLLRLAREGQSAEERASLVDTIVEEVGRADLEYVHAEMPKAIAQSLGGVEHVSRIVKAMKDFSHPGTDAKIAVDLNRAIETTLTVARNELKYVAETATDLDPDLPMVPCLPGEINQVLLNLLINAAHAIADVVGSDGQQQRGRITVSTRCIGDAAEIRVTDTGTGIPEASRPRIFEPFFTTKPVGRGTGQGLSLAHGVIVRRHGGRIWFETESGKGTTFIVRLPLETSPGALDSPLNAGTEAEASSSERRTFTRRAPRVAPGPLRVRHGTAEGRLVNISELGALVHLGAPPPLNSHMTIEVEWRDVILQLSGRVVRSHPVPAPHADGATSQTDRYVAIEFTAVPSASEAILRQLIQPQ